MTEINRKFRRVGGFINNMDYVHVIDENTTKVILKDGTVEIRILPLSVCLAFVVNGDWEEIF